MSKTQKSFSSSFKLALDLASPIELPDLGGFSPSRKSTLPQFDSPNLFFKEQNPNTSSQSSSPSSRKISAHDRHPRCDSVQNLSLDDMMASPFSSIQTGYLTTARQDPPLGSLFAASHA